MIYLERIQSINVDEILRNGDTVWVAGHLLPEYMTFKKDLDKSWLEAEGKKYSPLFPGIREMRLVTEDESLGAVSDFIRGFEGAMLGYPEFWSYVNSRFRKNMLRVNVGINRENVCRFEAISDIELLTSPLRSGEELARDIVERQFCHTL